MIKDIEKWKEYEEQNDDPYGKCCVDVAREVMRLLDEDSTPFHSGYYPDIHTPHGIICQADENIKAGGITGFMSGCVASMVSVCHSRGEEFRKQWNMDNQIKDEGKKVTESGGIINPALLSIEVK